MVSIHEAAEFLVVATQTLRCCAKGSSSRMGARPGGGAMIWSDCGRSNFRRRMWHGARWLMPGVSRHDQEGSGARRKACVKPVSAKQEVSFVSV
jgi:hypothetical protein